MDTNVKLVLMWLRAMQRNSANTTERRQQAFYIINFYGRSRNVYHLFAQFIAMCREELPVLQPSIRSSSFGPSTLVARHGSEIEDIVDRFRVVPANSDFEAHPFEMLSAFPKALEATFDAQTRVELHNKMIQYQRLAQDQLQAFAGLFGYHYVFRAGLREYFLTKIIVEYYNFMRVDARGQEWRRRTQMTFYELLDKYPNMKLEELRIAINSTQAYPYDILMFRNWLISGRKAYHAMRACLGVLTGRTFASQVQPGSMTFTRFV